MIDGLDARLIDLLTARPRIGVLDASRRLGVARGTVQARLDRLRSRGVITGFGPEVDPAALGYGVTAFVTLEIRQAGGHDPVAERRGVDIGPEPRDDAPGPQPVQPGLDRPPGHAEPPGRVQHADPRPGREQVDEPRIEAIDHSYLPSGSMVPSYLAFSEPELCKVHSNPSHSCAS